MRLGALTTKGGNLVVVVVVVVTTVVCVAGAKENWPTVLSTPKAAMLGEGCSLVRLLSSTADAEILEAKGDLTTSLEVVR